MLHSPLDCPSSGKRIAKFQRWQYWLAALRALERQKKESKQTQFREFPNSAHVQVSLRALERSGSSSSAATPIAAWSRPCPRSAPANGVMFVYSYGAIHAHVKSGSIQRSCDSEPLCIFAAVRASVGIAGLDAVVRRADN